MRTLLAALAGLLIAAAPAGAQTEGAALVRTLDEATRAVSINFLQYAGGRDVMLVSTQDGLRSYDITRDPADPQPLDVLTKEELMLPGDELTRADGDLGFWENEDMDVDRRRKLAFLSRDVGAFGGATMGVQIVDAADPANLRVGRFVALPVGHTTTCIEDCDFLWTAGVSTRGEIWVTDVRDPANPLPARLPHVVECRGVVPAESAAASSHDVQVDSTGVAWVSGQGAVRGYWTRGIHTDPFTGLPRQATPVLPIPYGGGVITRDGAERWMHNSERPGGGDVLYATEETYGECGTAGGLVIASLKGHTAGEVDSELEVLGRWTPDGQPGEGDRPNCMAHYFQVQGDLLVQAFYEQGVRFLDVSDPAHPVQVAYHRPDDADARAPYLHRGLVYVADNARGVDILRIDRPGARRRVVAPPLGPRESTLQPSPGFGWLCPLPA